MKPAFSAFAFLSLTTLVWGAAEDPLFHWRSGVTIHPVSDVPGRHTIHTLE